MRKRTIKEINQQLQNFGAIVSLLIALLGGGYGFCLVLNIGGHIGPRVGEAAAAGSADSRRACHAAEGAFLAAIGDPDCPAAEAAAAAAAPEEG